MHDHFSMRLVTKVVVSAIALTTTLAACDLTSDTVTDEENELVESRTSFLSEGPLTEAQALAWQDRRALLIARELLLQECMEGRGWGYPLVIPPTEEPDSNDDSAIADAAADREDYLGSLTVAERSQWSDDLLGDGEIVELGDTGFSFNKGGCLDEVENELYSDRAEYFEVRALIDLWLAQSYDQAVADHEVADAATSWAECMQEAGYDRWLAPTEFGSADPASWPIEADVECQRQVGYDQAITDAYVEAQSTIYAENEALIVDWLRMRDDAVRYAINLTEGR